MHLEKSKLIRLVLCLLILGCPCFGALAFDAASSGTPSTGSAVTWTHTVSGSNTICIVGIAYKYSAATSISSVTVGGSAATHVAGADADNGVNSKSEIWISFCPAGVNSITVTPGANITSLIPGVISLTGAAQSGQPDNSANTNSSASVTSISKAITVNTANSWIVDTLRVGSSPTSVTPGGGATTRWNASEGANDQGFSSTNGPMAAGSQTDSWSWTNATSGVALSIVSVAPASGSAACGRPIALTGVGCR